MKEQKLRKLNEKILYYRQISFGIHRTFDEQPITWDLGDSTIKFLIKNLDSNMRTFETGAGLSTFLFADLGHEHHVVTPSSDEIKRIKNLFHKNNLFLDKVNFYCERSESVLPKLELSKKLDLILIDGGHGFPTPFIDFYYSSTWLKTGGFLILDDIYFPATFHLFKFLKINKYWCLEKILDGRTAIFRKISPHAGDEMQDWYTQSWYSGIKFKSTNSTVRFDIIELIKVIFVPFFTVFYHLFDLLFHFVITPLYYKIIQKSYYRIVHPGFYKVIHPFFYQIISPTYYLVRKIYLHTLFQIPIKTKVVGNRIFCFIKLYYRLDKVIFHFLWVYWPDSLRKKELKKRFPQLFKNLFLEEI